MKRLKILYIITKANWGGAQKYVFELATRLPKDQYEVKVAVGGTGILTEKLQAAGIEVITLGSMQRDISLKKEMATAFELYKLLRKEKPDVLHINSSKAGGLGAFIGKLAKVPKIVFTAHGWAFNENRNFFQKILIRFLHWFTILFSHRTIAASESIRKPFIHWPGGRKIVVIHHGIESMTSYSKDNARHVLEGMYEPLKLAVGAIPASKIFWLGTVAELHHIKGLTSAIKAVAQIVKNSNMNGKKMIYTIMGEGEERPKLEALIQETGLTGTVFLLGRVDSAMQYMKAFDVFLLSSLSEALGYVILEAGLQEVPVIATNVGGIPEIIEDTKTGILIQPKKAREIAHAIEFYARDMQTAKEYAKALKANIVEKFSFKRMLEETEEVYGK